MGTTYFVIFIASIVAGVIMILLKLLLENISRSQGYTEALEELREFDHKNEIEHRRFEVYSHNYMVDLEQARCKKVQSKKMVDTVI